jgi:hypothetical protein
MTDRTDDLITALVKAREAGISAHDAAVLVRDVWDAPWLDDPMRTEIDNYNRSRIRKVAS